MNLGRLSGKILVFGGPYSNFQATEAIKNIAEDEAIPKSNVICTGDLVAYCGKPEETVDLIRAWGIHVVMGNCEESLGFSMDDCGCGFEEDSKCSTLSVRWYNYARTRVSDRNKNWMSKLPREISFTLGDKSFHVIHGGVENISQFVFDSTDIELKHQQIARAETDVMIGGHCGIPFGQSINDAYWLNAGVIGMPANDGSNNGWYMTLEETQDNSVDADWHTLEFDFQASARDMRNQAMGPEYHDALLSGLWPSMDVLPDQEKAMQGRKIELQRMALFG